MDNERAREIVELLNGEGNCARCDDRPFGQHELTFSGVQIKFCSGECLLAFVRGIKAAGELRIL